MSSKMIVVKSSDGETFEVEEAVALESETIKRMIEEDNRANTTITLPITSKILAKMIEYCKRHVHAAAKSNADGASTMAVDEDLKAFDAEFVKDEPKTLYDILSAACNLRIKSLIDLTAQTLADTIADMSKGTTPMEFRKTFDFLTKDLQLLEEEEARSQIAYLRIDDKCNR